MGELYDAPNQQVVRGDGSGPADEGKGGSKPRKDRREQDRRERDEPDQEDQIDLDSMTKAQLLELAQSRGVSPANNDMTKD
jgi:hypothetical protein